MLSSPGAKRLDALRRPLEKVNLEMKLIMTDLLVQQPEDPFAFVAARLRAAGGLAHNANAEPHQQQHPQQHQKQRMKKALPPAVIVSNEMKALTTADKKKRRGMQPPALLVKFYYGAYRFSTVETARVFSQLKSVSRGTMVVRDEGFRPIISANAAYAERRMDDRVADRLFMSLSGNTTTLSVVGAASALCALSRGRIDEKVRAAFYFHGVKVDRGAEHEILGVGHDVITGVLKAFFVGGLRCATQMELNGLGEHVRARLRDAYGADAKLLESAISRFTRRAMKSGPLGRATGGPGGISFRDLCVKLRKPQAWSEVWGEIWKLKQKGSRPEPSKIVVARWVHALLYDLDVNKVEAEEGGEGGADVATYFLFSPRSSAAEGQNTRENQETAATITLQSGFRGYRDRKNLKLEKKKREDDAATKMQSTFRGRVARERRKLLQKQRDTSATRLQSTFRGHQERKRLSEKQ